MSTDPPVTPASEPYWEATRRRELVLQRCAACRGWVHPPRPRCPHCLADELGWSAPEDEPRLHAWALHRGTGDAPDRMVILVDVADGVRTLSNLEGDREGIAIGHPLRLAWRELPDGRALPVYRLAPPTGP